MKDDRGRERGKVREYFLKVSFKYHIQKGAPVITTQNFDKENKLVEPAPRSRNRVRQPGAFLVLLTGTPTGTSKSLDYFAHFGGFMDTGTRGRVFFHGWFCFLSCLSHTLACSAVVNSPTDNTKCQRGCGGPRTLLSCQGRGGGGGRSGNWVQPLWKIEWRCLRKPSRHPRSDPAPPSPDTHATESRAPAPPKQHVGEKLLAAPFATAPNSKTCKNRGIFSKWRTFFP